MSALPEVFAVHECDICPKRVFLDPNIDLPEGWELAHNEHDDLVELCPVCAAGNPTPQEK